MTRESRFSVTTSIALLTIAGVTGVTLWRLGVLAAFPFELYGDEAQYWVWAQALDVGYYSKPPLIAGLIAASTAVLGDGALGVKAFSPLLYALAAVALGWTAARWHDARAGVLAGGLFLTLPAVSLGALVASTDAPLFAAWCGTLAVLTHLAHGGQRWGWYAVGVLAGIALLAKYNAVILAPMILLWMLVEPTLRHWLKRPEPYVAAALTTAIVAPNLLWNARHDFVSLRHTQDLAQRAHHDLTALLQALAEQAGTLGPVLWGLLVLAGLRATWTGLQRWMRPLVQPSDTSPSPQAPTREQTHHTFWNTRREPCPEPHRGPRGETSKAASASPSALRFALAFSLPWLAILLIIGLQGRLNANWFAPAWPGLLLAAIVAWPALRRWSPLTWAVLGSHLLVLVLLMHVAPRIPEGHRLDAFASVRGHAELTIATLGVVESCGSLRIIVGDRMLTAQLIYHAHRRTHSTAAPTTAAIEIHRWHPTQGRPSDHFQLTRPWSEPLSHAVFVGLGPPPAIAPGSIASATQVLRAGGKSVHITCVRPASE